MNRSELEDIIKPVVLGWIDEVLDSAFSMATSGSGSTTSGVFDASQYPDALLRDGSRSLLQSLDVADGALIDGRDVSVDGTHLDNLESSFATHDAQDATTAHGNVGAHDHSTTESGGQINHSDLGGLGNDDHSQYASANGSGTRIAYRANSVSKNVYGGAGLVNNAGTTLLTNDVTLDVGQGAGIIVGTNDVSIDQSFNPTWTGNHQFNANLVSSALLPRSASTYDVGAIDKKYRIGNFEEFRAFVFAELELNPVGGFIIVAKDQGNLDAAVATGDTTIDFGKGMVVGDMVDLRTNGQYERLQVGTLVSGTRYNVSRNLDGSGTNAWNVGDVWVNFGQSLNNNGWLQLNGYDSPRLQIYKKGSAWNNDLELVRLGDLNGNWGYSTSKFGLAIGDYAANKANIVLDEDGTLRIRNYTANVVQLGSDGIFDLVGTMKVSGEIQANNGSIKISPSGMKMIVPVGSGTLDTAKSYSFVDESNNVVGTWGDFYLSGTHLSSIQSKSVSDYDTGLWLTAYAAEDKVATAQLGVATSGFPSTLFKVQKTTTERLAQFSGIDRIYADQVLFQFTYASLPVSGMIDGDSIFCTTYRAWFYYNGTAWIQTSVGTFSSSFPSSPVDKLRVFRSDRNIEYFWNNATSQWLSSESFSATSAEVRVLAPYTNANIGTTDTFVLIYHLDTRSYAIRVVDSYFFYQILTTNDASNYYTYRIDVSANGATTSNLIAETSTAALGTNVTGVATITDTAIAQNSNGARSSIILKRVGSPTNFTFRGMLKYRLIG